MSAIDEETLVLDVKKKMPSSIKISYKMLKTVAYEMFRTNRLAALFTWICFYLQNTYAK